MPMRTLFSAEKILTVEEGYDHWKLLCVCSWLRSIFWDRSANSKYFSLAEGHGSAGVSADGTIPNVFVETVSKSTFISYYRRKVIDDVLLFVIAIRLQFDSKDDATGFCSRLRSKKLKDGLNSVSQLPGELLATSEWLSGSLDLNTLKTKWLLDPMKVFTIWRIRIHKQKWRKITRVQWLKPVFATGFAL